MEGLEQKRVLRIKLHDLGCSFLALSLISLFVGLGILSFLEEERIKNLGVILCAIPFLLLLLLAVKRREWKDITLDGEQNLIHFRDKTVDFTRSLDDFKLKSEIEHETWTSKGKKRESIVFALKLVKQDNDSEEEFYISSLLWHKKLQRLLKKFKPYFPNLEEDLLTRLVLEHPHQSRYPNIVFVYLVFLLIQAFSWNYLKQFVPQLSSNQYLVGHILVLLLGPILVYPQSKVQSPEKIIWKSYKEIQKQSKKPLAEAFKRKLASASDEELIDLYMYFHTSEGKEDILSREYFSGSPNRDRLCELLLGHKNTCKISAADKMELTEWIKERIPKQITD